jgi:serine/threonine protein kinase
MTQQAPGARLGPYEIQALLGEGGMGQVFRGVDTRIGRSVAIKICHEQFSDRFNREARAISSLNLRTSARSMTLVRITWSWS